MHFSDHLKKTTFKCLHFITNNAVLNVAIDNGEINLLDRVLLKDLYQLHKILMQSDDIKVVVFRSANTEFFIAHADINMIMAMKDAQQPDGKIISPMQKIFENYSQLPQVTIAEIDGITRGGGSEFVLALDMRFATLENATLAQPEAALGIIAGAGGCNRLPPLVGKARALEILLGCEDFDAATAERYGYINRALSTDNIASFVDKLAQQIASFPRQALIATKQQINNACAIDPLALANEYQQMYRCAVADTTQHNMAKALSLGMQTKEAELQSLLDITKQL